MKIAVNAPSIPYGDPKRPITSSAAPASPPLLGLGLAGLKLPEGFGLTAASARALGLPSRTGITTPGFPIFPVKLETGRLPVRIISPSLAAARSTDPRIIQGVHDFTRIFSEHCGKGVKLTHDFLRFGYDFIAFYRDTKDPEVSRSESFVELSELGSSFCSILAGLFDARGFEQASGSLHYVAVFSDHFSSGRVGLSQSETVGLSSAEHADEYSAILELGEIFQTTT